MILSISKITLLGGALLGSLVSVSQDVNRTLAPGYDPHYDKILPDKIFEIGLPLVVLFIIANSISNIFKIRAENKLKEKALDRQLSEQTLVSLFSEDKKLFQSVFLKWFFILGAIGLSLIFIYFLFTITGIRSGYLALGIITTFMAFAFLAYYKSIQRK